MRHLAPFVLALALAACQTPTVGPGAEDEISLARGRAEVRAGAGKVVIRTADGRSLAGASVLVGDRLVTLRDGGLDLALLGAKGRVIVLAPGYAPAELDLAKGGELVLRPVAGAAAATTLAAAGGTVRGGGASVEIPPGRLTKDQTGVQVGSYVPAPPTGPADPGPRTAFLQAVGGPFVASACDAPVPCPPATDALGLVIYVDGPLGPGPLRVTYDLATLAGGPQAAAAEKLRAVFRAMDAASPDYRRALARDHGVTLAGDALTFEARLPAGIAAGGGTRIQVAAFGLLGVALEVTVVSAPGGALPPAANPLPGTLPGTSPGTLPGTGPGPVPGTGPGLGAGVPPFGFPPGSVVVPGVTLVSDLGGSLIPDGGIGIVSDLGGSLVGKVRSPFAGPPAKRRLLAYTDVPLAGAAVLPLDSAGRRYLAASDTDAAGAFAFSGFGQTAKLIYLEARQAGVTIRGAAPAPGSGTSDVLIDAATTGIAAWMLDDVRTGAVRPENARYAGYQADANLVRPLLSQADAELLVRAEVPAAAAFMRAFFAARGLTPSWRQLFTTFAVGAIPHGVAIDAAGNAWVVVRGDNAVKRVSPAGVVAGPFPVGASPLDVAIDPAGDVWVSNTGSANVTKLRPDGSLIGTFPAGSSPHIVVFGPGGEAWVPNNGDGSVSRFTSAGAPLGTYAVGAGAWGMVVDAAGAPWVAATNANVVKKLGPDGSAQVTIAVDRPRGLIFDAAGDLWVALQFVGRIAKFSPAGAALGEWPVDAGLRSLAVEADGDLWAACRDANTLVELGPDGTRKRTVPTGPLPFDLTIDAEGRIWFTTEGDGNLNLYVP